MVEVESCERGAKTADDRIVLEVAVAVSKQIRGLRQQLPLVRLLLDLRFLVARRHRIGEHQPAPAAAREPPVALILMQQQNVAAAQMTRTRDEHVSHGSSSAPPRSPSERNRAHHDSPLPAPLTSPHTLQRQCPPPQQARCGQRAGAGAETDSHTGA